MGYLRSVEKAGKPDMSSLKGMSLTDLVTLYKSIKAGEFADADTSESDEFMQEAVKRKDPEAMIYMLGQLMGSEPSVDFSKYINAINNATPPTESASSKNETQLKKLKDQLSLAREKRKMKGERLQSKREVDLSAKIHELESGIAKTKNIWGK